MKTESPEIQALTAPTEEPLCAIHERGRAPHSAVVSR